MKHVTLLLIEKNDKRRYVLIKDFNTFMSNHTLHSRRRYFCRYFPESFATEEILKSHVEDGFKINGTQMIKMTKKVE